MKAFTSSSKLKNSLERASSSALDENTRDDRAIFFDYLSWKMIVYSRKNALVLHSLPIVIFFLLPFFLCYPNIGLSCWLRTLCEFMKGMLYHFIAILLGVIFPVIFAVLRLFFSSHAMSWFAHPYLAFLMFIPCSIVGQLVPAFFLRRSPLPQDASSLKTVKKADEAMFWGAFGLYALITLVYLLAGLSGGFLTFILLIFMLPARLCFCFFNQPSSHHSLKSTMAYVIPLIPSLIYSVYFCGFLVQFLIEKMGMLGSLPEPYGYFVPDIVVALVVGLVTASCFGSLLPVAGHWLARSSVMKFLLHFTVLALALSSQFFPYNLGAPKRLIFQHTYVTSGATEIKNSNYDLSVVDSNSLKFLFKHAPEAAKELQITSEVSLEHVDRSDQGTWMVLFPVSYMFTESLKFPTKSDDILKRYNYFPYISETKPHAIYNMGSRKVYLDLNLGSLEEVWVTVLNITGPLSNWSFADNQLPVPEKLKGGPPSYILRLSGSSHKSWTFWLEANSSEPLRVDVSVLDQYVVAGAKKLKGLFPDWVDVTAYSSFLSSYLF